MSSAEASTLRIGVVGGGFAGLAFARQLCNEWDSISCPGPRVEVVVYESAAEERTDHWTQPGGGAALNINANGMALIRDHDTEFYNKLRNVSYPRRQIKSTPISTISLSSSSSSSLQHFIFIQDIVESGLADCYGCVCRWSDAVNIARSLCREQIRFESRVVGVDFSDLTKTFTLCIKSNGKEEKEEFDFIIAADGRYSTIRKLLEFSPEKEEEEGVNFHGVYNFRLHVPDDSPAGLLDDDLELLYNFPDSSDELFGKMSAFCGLARIGVAKCPPSEVFPNGSVYLFGNFSTEGDSEESSDMVKSSTFLRALYTPVGGDARLTDKGRWLVNTLSRHSHRLHWSRFQSIQPKFTTTLAESCPPIIYLGDASHAFPPSLGLGASSAVEDGYAAAKITLSELKARDFIDFDSKSSRLALLQRMTTQFAETRRERIELITRLSVEASRHMLPHVVDSGPAGKMSQMQIEINNWTAQGGFFLSGIQEIWKGYQLKILQHNGKSDKKNDQHT